MHTKTLYKAIQSQNVPVATAAFNSIIRERMLEVVAREYRVVAETVFNEGDALDSLSSPASIAKSLAKAGTDHATHLASYRAKLSKLPDGTVIGGWTKISFGGDDAFWESRSGKRGVFDLVVEIGPRLIDKALADAGINESKLGAELLDPGPKGDGDQEIADLLSDLDDTFAPMQTEGLALTADEQTPEETRAALLKLAADLRKDGMSAAADNVEASIQYIHPDDYKPKKLSFSRNPLALQTESRADSWADRPTRMSAATTIIDQLGGNRFIAMTGAKNFLSFGPSAQGLRFKCNRKVYAITLNANDTYTVTQYNSQGNELTHVDNVYSDSLQRVFTSMSGLDTHL